MYESDKLSCFFDSEIAVPLRNGVVSSQIEFFCMEDQGKQSSLVCCNRRAKLKNHAWSSISLICKDLALNKYSLIQNAGSDINEYYNGYDIGMGERDAKKYQQKYDLTVLDITHNFDEREEFDEVIMVEGGRVSLK